MSVRRLRLGAHLHPQYGWASDQEGHLGAFSGKPYADFARKAEDALLDVLFRADGFSFVPDNAVTFRHGSVDPLLSLAAAAAVTRNIGLVATLSTTFGQPYVTARQVLSLDHLSDGRAGWNAVTSFSGERAFSAVPIPDQTERYARATEFLQIVNGLWSTWGDGALLQDKASGRFGDPSKITPFAFRGQYFDIVGTSQLPPSPQGRPVQFQAGASREGKAFAARFAEAIFSASPDIGHARALYAEVKGLVTAAGRDPDQFLIMPGAGLVLGATKAEAWETYRALVDGLDLDSARRGAAAYLGGTDLSALALDEPIPHHLLPADTALLHRRRSRAELLKQVAVKPGATLRDVLLRFLLGDGGHFQTVQSYDGAADVLADWFETGAADGFVVSFPARGDQFDRFIEHVIPRLQDRGLFHRAYEGGTLRENLGLARP